MPETARWIETSARVQRFAPRPWRCQGDSHASAHGPRLAVLRQQPGLIGLLLLVWWSVLLGEYLVPHTADLTLSAAATEEGSLFNTLLVTAFALLGACCLTKGLPAVRSRPLRILLVLLSIYLAWALVSITWSVDPGLTLRRHVQLCLLVIGSFGLGVGYYGSSAAGPLRLVNHVVVAGVVAIVILWASLLASGNVDLLNPTWAAKDLGAGTRIGYPIAFSMIAALHLFQHRRLASRTLLLVLIAGLVSLFAQKVRFIFAFTVLVLVIQHLSATRWTWQRVAAYASVLALVGWSLGMLVGLQGTEPLRPLTDTASSYATLDSSDTTLESLTGRTPLWAELMRYVADRPWTGYGFGAFWNPEYMFAIWAVIPWHPPVGHDGYLDETLATGATGLVLFLGLWLTGLVVAWRQRFTQQVVLGEVVGCWMLFFLLANVGDTIMQAYFQFPFYAALVGLFALAARPDGLRARE